MFTLYPEYDDGDDDDNYSVAAGRANCSLVGTAGVALSRVEGGPADLESLLIRGENLTLQLSMSTDVEGLPVSYPHKSSFLLFSITLGSPTKSRGCPFNPTIQACEHCGR